MLPDKCACNVYDDIYAARCHCQFYTWFGAKPQNLRKVNISGYTIVHKLRTVLPHGHCSSPYLQYTTKDQMLAGDDENCSVEEFPSNCDKLCMVMIL